MSYCTFRHGDTGKYGSSEEDNFVLELASGDVHSVLFVIRELFVSVNCLVLVSCQDTLLTIARSERSLV